MSNIQLPKRTNQTNKQKAFPRPHIFQLRGEKCTNVPSEDINKTSAMKQTETEIFPLLSFTHNFSSCHMFLLSQVNTAWQKRRRGLIDEETLTIYLSIIYFLNIPLLITSFCLFESLYIPASLCSSIFLSVSLSYLSMCLNWTFVIFIFYEVLLDLTLNISKDFCIVLKMLRCFCL